LEVRSPLSTEYIRVPVAASVAGTAINPTSDTVQIAVVPTGSVPATGDWNAATWETDAVADPDIYYARLLVGPPPGVVGLSAGNIYDVYVKVFDNPETVVRNSGAIGIL
jgi:hypothetical protein